MIKKVFKITCFSIILSLLLTSCENFLDSAQLNSEIQKEIAYSNATEVSVQIAPGLNQGTTNPSGTYSKKVGYSFEIAFTEAEKYQFYRWAAVNSETGYEYNEEVTFENPKSLKTNVTVNSKINNLWIKPLCIERLAVTSHAPAAGTAEQYANTPIVAEFNMPVDPEKINFSNIYILCGGESISHLFETPVLSQDGKKVTITPKALEIVDFIKSKNAAFIDVRVTFTNVIKGKINDVESSLLENDNTNWTFRYKPATELTGPEKFAFEVSKIIPATVTPAVATEGLLLQKTVENFAREEEYHQNHIKDTVYITGRFYDSESGIGSVVVEEVRTNNKDAGSVDRTGAANEYDFIKTFSATSSENPLSISYDGAGYAVFAFPYKLQSAEDGAVKLSVRVLDNCGNPSGVQKISVLKDTVMDLSDLKPFNCILPFMTGATSTYEEDLAAYNEQKNEFKIRSTGDGALIHKFYGEYTEKTENISISYEYEGSNGKETGLMSWDSTNAWWKTNLNVNSLNELKVKLNIKNEIGAVSEKKIDFPRGVLVLDIAKASDKDYGYIFVNLVSTNTGCILLRSDCSDVKVSSPLFESYYRPEKRVISDSSVYRTYKDAPAYAISLDNNLFGDLEQIDITKTSFEQTDKVIKIKNIKYESCGANSGLYDVTINFEDNFFEDFKYGTMTIKWEADNEAYKFYSQYDYNPVDFVIAKGQCSYTFRKSYIYLKKSFLVVTAYDYQGKITKTKSKYSDNLINCGIYDEITKVYDSSDLKDNSPSEISAYEYEDITKLTDLFNNVSLDYCSMPIIKCFDGVNAYSFTNPSEKVEIVSPESARNNNSCKIERKLGSQNLAIRHFLFSDCDLDEDEGVVTIKATDKDNLVSEISLPYKIVKLSEPEIDCIWDETSSKYTLDVNIENVRNECFNPVVYKEKLTLSGWKKIGDDEKLDPKTYIRVGVLGALEETTGSAVSKKWASSPYVYIYLGDDDDFDGCNYLETASSIQITSNSDVRVQVIRTSKPYSECRKWTVKKWLTRHEVVEDKLIQFSELSSKYYYIPKDKIAFDSCYTTIVYFGDYPVQMGVYQK